MQPPSNFDFTTYLHHVAAVMYAVALLIGIAAVVVAVKPLLVRWWAG